MPKVYINGIACISVQPENILEKGKVIEYHENILKALDQDYKSLIKPMMLRRMSTAVKMGLFNSKRALAEAGIENPQAIIVGTGQGCLEDTEKFLQNMITTDEGLLSPTSFIQSTHNTVAGQIALSLKCNAYNMTYTQNSTSLESALIDGIMQLQEASASNILVGGVDETSEKLTGFQEFDGQLKNEKIRNLDLLRSETAGSIASESSGFFVLASEKTDSSYAEILDVGIQNRGDISEVSQFLVDFLEKNHLKKSDIDILVSGRNGDQRYLDYYRSVEEQFQMSQQLAYKHLVGENNSISAYALWMASKILKLKNIPEIFKLNQIKCEDPEYVLIYNQYLGRNHTFILLKKI